VAFTVLILNLDLGACFAALSDEIVGPEMVQKMIDIEKKKSCLIVSFGEYEKELWCPALILFYR